MNGIIDFHAHILPGVDDGSCSVEESIAMLRMEAEQGIKHVVATPHFYPRQDTPERFLKRRAEAESLLRQEMAKYDGLPGLSVGAEVYFYNGISDSDAIKEFAIDGKRGVLIEMPHPPWSESMYRELENLYVKRSLIPIIAHVDRYISPFRTYGIPQRLAELPVLVQANAKFFLKRSTSAMALRMFKKDYIHLVGSDCHHPSSGKADLGAAVQLLNRRLGENAVEAICACQRRVLADE